MLNKIDNNDLTVQLESNRIDVWVPDGLAISKRMSESHELVPANTVAATSIADEEHTKFLENNNWVFSFAGKQTKKPTFLDATVTGGDQTDASISKTFGRDVGPIAIQNKVPIPVTPGMQVSMAGKASIRRTGMNHSVDDTKSPLLVRFDLWAAGYEEDEYGEETDIKLNLMAFTQSLQNISGLFQPVGSALISYTIPQMQYMTVPQGCDRIFITVSYIAANNSEYSSVSYNSEGGGGFLSPRYEAPVNFAYLPVTNALRILTKQAESSSIVEDNTLSVTKAAFKNRPFFENVFPLFDYINVLNSGFNDDLNNWSTTGATTISTDTPHTATKCVKIVNSGSISGPALTGSPGDKVYMSAWMRNIDFSGPGGLRMQKRVGSTWSDIASGSVTTANSQWIKSEIKVVLPPDAEAFRLRAAFAGTGTIYLDDLESAFLEDDSEITFMGRSYPPTQPPASYLSIPNYNFESGTTGWSGFAGSDSVTGGKLSLKGNSTASNIYSTDAFSVNPGSTMYIEVNVGKMTAYSGAGQQIIGMIFFSDTDSTPLYIDAIATACSDSKTLGRLEPVRSDITVPAGKNRMRINFRLEATVTAGEWQYDDVRVTDLTPPLIPSSQLSTSIEIYEWNGSRGPLIKSDSVTAGQKKTIPISSTTGMIEVVKPGAITPANMGLLKNSAQGPITISQWVNITSMDVNQKMLGTNLVGNSLVMNYAGIISIDAYIQFAGARGKHEKGVRILKNGVVVADSTFTTKFETTGMSGKTPAITVAVGDTISFQAYSNAVSDAQRTIKSGTHFELIYAVASQSGNDFFIESVLAKEWDTLDQNQNQLESVQYNNVVDEVASVSIERSEADAGTMTLKFCSDVLDPRTNALLQIGRNIRVLARHYGPVYSYRPNSWVGEALYETVMIAKIKRIEVTYDYENEPQITVTAYDGFQKMDSTKLGLAYDTMEEYGPALNNVGVVTRLDGQNWTGPQSALPGELMYFPSTYGSMTVMDALIMTRNTLKKYLFFNKNNELIIKSSLDSQAKLEFTDGTIAGDLSMGNVKQGIDTETIINAIDIEENLLDRSSFIERTASAAEPPEMFKTIEGKQRSVRYQDNASIAAFGEYSKKFQVVRGSGSYSDLKADKFGPTFISWAEGILETYSVPRIYISEMSSPVKDSATMFMLANLEILDKVKVHYQFETYEVRVRSMKISISPGKWNYEYKFLPKADQAYW